MTSSERIHAAETILAFLGGRRVTYDWDDFISAGKKDAEHQQVSDFCAASDVLFPPEDESSWCSSEGEAKLRELAEMLRSDVPFAEIGNFIDEEWNRAALEPYASGLEELPPSLPPKPRKSGWLFVFLIIAGILVWWFWPTFNSPPSH